MIATSACQQSAVGRNGGLLQISEPTGSATPAQPAAPQGGAYAELPEGWPARFRCDSCDGNGEVGEPISMGHFQPPERERCPDCGGRGWCSEEAAFSADDMRDFADRTHALRASHGQAPAKSTPYPGCSYWGMRDTPATAQPAPASTIPNAALADLHEGLAAKLHDGPARNLHLETAAALRAPAAGAVPVAYVQRLVGHAPSISWRHKDIADLPDGTALIAATAQPAPAATKGDSHG